MVVDFIVCGFVFFAVIIVIFVSEHSDLFANLRYIRKWCALLHSRINNIVVLL